MDSGWGFAVSCFLSSVFDEKLDLGLWTKTRGSVVGFATGVFGYPAQNVGSLGS